MTIKTAAVFGVIFSIFIILGLLVGVAGCLHARRQRHNLPNHLSEAELRPPRHLLSRAEAERQPSAALKAARGQRRGERWAGERRETREERGRRNGPDSERWFNVELGDLTLPARPAAPDHERRWTTRAGLFEGYRVSS